MRESLAKVFNLFFGLFVLILLLTAPFASFASPAGPGGGPENPIEPDYDPDTVVPIDGGASLLVAAGVAYGLKKIHDKRKQNKDNTPAA